MKTRLYLTNLTNFRCLVCTRELFTMTADRIRTQDGQWKQAPVPVVCDSCHHPYMIQDLSVEAIDPSYSLMFASKRSSEFLVRCFKCGAGMFKSRRTIQTLIVKLPDQDELEFQCKRCKQKYNIGV